MNPPKLKAIDIALKLGGHQSGDGWIAHCPLHDDEHPSLSIDEMETGKVLLHCHAGCDQDEVYAHVARLVGFSLGDDKVASGDNVSAAVHRHQEQRRPQDQDLNRSGLPASGVNEPELPCRLENYARIKKLDLEFLRRVGLSDARYLPEPAVRIAYRDRDGNEVATKFRTRLAGDNRFRWKTGSKPCLYGLDRLEQGRQVGYAVIVEGESDCHTLWMHEIPAVGVPGASNWDERRDAHQFERIAKIYVVIEPDAGGSAVLNWVMRSSIRDRAWLIALAAEWKDVSALYLSDPAGFPERWAEQMANAVSAADFAQDEARHAQEQAWENCKDLAQKPRILDELYPELERRGVAGERRAIGLVYLAITSRFLDRPVSIALKAGSSVGKSFVLDKVMGFFPASAFYKLTAGSERSLVYTEESLSHRLLVISEAAGIRRGFMEYCVRSLLSEGHLTYQTVEKTPEGLRPRVIEVKGPTGLLMTTTAIRVHAENETRLLSVLMTDTREQTARIFEFVAREDTDALPNPQWIALQQYLECAEHSATISYGIALARCIPPSAVRLRRDFGKVLSLIRAHAILHQATRNRDAEGRIIATLDDYGVVRELVMDIIGDAAQVSVPKAVRETVAAVRELEQESGTCTVADVGRLLGLEGTTAWRRVREEISRGFVINEEHEKSVRGRLHTGTPLPQDELILPAPDDARLMAACKVEK